MLVVSKNSNNSHHSKGNLAIKYWGRGQINLKSKKLLINCIHCALYPWKKKELVEGNFVV